MNTTERLLITWGEEGLQRAIERLEAAFNPHSASGQFTSALEAVVWICALDEAHERRIGPVVNQYKSARDADPDGVVIRGLRWARHRGVHQLVRVHARLGRSPIPILIGSVGPLVWTARAFAQGPKQKEKHRNRDLEKAYDQAVRGRPVLDPVRRARRWLPETVWREFPLTNRCVSSSRKRSRK